MKAALDSIEALVERFDASVFDAPAGRARIRLEVTDAGTVDALVSGDRVQIEPARGRPDAELKADLKTWRRIGTDLAGGMEAFARGRLAVRRNLHLGAGFLAATSGDRSPGRLSFRTIETAKGRLSALEAGTGEPIVLLHGLGGTKASFLPTVAALAPLGYRTIALDLPGFGDSDKPFPAPYDARFFARHVIAGLDALDLSRTHLLGHSLGGRVALEIGMHSADRLDGLILMTPSLAWRAPRPWARYLRLVRPELGAIQPAPRPIVTAIVRSSIAGAGHSWVDSAIDEFLRAYLTPRGRAAFYAAARQIYLEDGDGASGFWTRLNGLRPRSLFIWGRRDQLVPIAFARHVRSTLPEAHHVEIDTGHVPQLEGAREVHGAIADFLAGLRTTGRRSRSAASAPPRSATG